MNIFEDGQSDRSIPATASLQCSPGVGVDFLFAAKKELAFDAVADKWDIASSDIDTINDTHSVKRVIIVDSSKSEQSSSEVDASASFGFGAFETSVAFNLLSQATVDERTFSLFVSVVQKSGGLRLTDQAIQKLRFSALAEQCLPNTSANEPKNNYDDFYKYFGDSFVVGKKTGGWFSFLVTYTCKDTSQKNEVSADIKTKGWFNADVNTKGSDWLNTHGIKISITCESQGVAVQPQITVGSSNPEDLLSVINYALGFSSANLIKGLGDDLCYFVQGYDECFQFKDKFLPRPEEVSNALTLLAERYRAYKGILNTITSIETNTPYLYDVHGLEIQASQDTTGSTMSLQELRESIETYMKDMTVGANQIGASTDQTRLQGIPDIVWVDEKKIQLPKPGDLLLKLPQRMAYYFTVFPSGNPDAITRVAEIQYKAWNGSLWSVGIITGVFRHTPIEPDKSPVLPGIPGGDDSRWYIPYIYAGNEDPHRNYYARNVIGQYSFQDGIFSHRDSNDNSFKGESNSVDFIGADGVRKFATVVKSDF